ncbi:MAG: molybdopterin molybdotransferase [Anaerolineaceae bacterium]|nr:MAG: molybdopterin molybdotransferase [Anaerolineaceae bacterium]
MSVYLHDIPLPDAKARLQSALEDAGLWRVLGAETIPLDEHAIGRVLAEPVWAKVSSPHYHASAMDGFAVRAADTVGAQPSTPVTFSLLPSHSPQAVYLDTGDALPEGFDAVIPIENVESLGPDGNLTSVLRQPSSVRIRAAVTPWSHVRPLGEDIVATQLVLPAGQALRPVDLGAAAAAGHRTVRVARRPRVAILPTGSELVPIGSDPSTALRQAQGGSSGQRLKPGDILEYNSLVLAAQIKAWGGEPTRFPITPDDFDAICARVQEAARDHDLILLNAGSSAGAEDFSAGVVEKLGTLLVHGVAVRPGHPVILGVIRNRVEGNKELGDKESGNKESGNKGLGEQETQLPNYLIPNPWIPIIGVPGYPVSAALTGEIFVEPLLARWTGRRPLEHPVAQARLTRKITSPAGDDDYVRVAVGEVGGKLLAAPLARGAGVISSLVRADGIVVLPRGVQGAEAGETVDVRLYRSRAELERTIFCIGSHDMTLDLLAQFLAQHDRRLASANVGSQAGLVALKRGEAHLAGSHLLDPETGEYNVAYLAQYLPGVPVRLMALVGREQGLLVKRGNPKGVKSLGDLSRQGVRFVNRQRGAGTRLLLDYHLSKMGISAESIQGYNQEEYTHLGVAAAVASGRADCGLGIAAAAQALDLDFVPLFQERYDLVIPKIHAESSLLAPLFEVVASAEFREAVGRMPGYDVTVMGKIIVEA